MVFKGTKDFAMMLRVGKPDLTSERLVKRPYRNGLIFTCAFDQMENPIKHGTRVFWRAGPEHQPVHDGSMCCKVFADRDRALNRCETNRNLAWLFVFDDM